MSVKVFKSVVNEKAPPKRVNNLVSVKTRKSKPAAEATPPPPPSKDVAFDAILNRARSKFVSEVGKKCVVASAKRRNVFQSIVAREKPPIKVS